jgi:hypothetical protein
MTLEHDKKRCQRSERMGRQIGCNSLGLSAWHIQSLRLSADKFFNMILRDLLIYSEYYKAQ